MKADFPFFFLYLEVSTMASLFESRRYINSELNLQHSQLVCEKLDLQGGVKLKNAE